MTKKEIEAMLRDLHSTLETHLRESGSIQNDLQWLKRAIWVLASSGVLGTGALLANLLFHGH